MSLIDLASMVLAPTAVKDGKVYNAIPNDQDFTFSRGTEATRVNSAGLIEKARTNFLLQSNTFDTTWVSIDISLTSGQSGYDGTNDAWLLTKNASSLSRIQQSQSISGVNTLSVYAKAGTSDSLRFRLGSNDYIVEFDLSTETSTNSGSIAAISHGIKSIGSGWYRCVATWNVTSASVVQIDNEFGVTSSNTILIQDAQLEQGLVATDVITTTTSSVTVGITDDLPRVDYSGGGCPALKLEPQRTNVVINSEYIASITDLTNGDGTISSTSNYAISPEGVKNATRIQASATGSNYALKSYTPASSVSGNYTCSMYIKSNTSSNQSINFYARGGNNVITVTPEWQRFVVVGVGSTNFVNFGITQASGQENIDILCYGLQMEQDVTYPTSLIPTYGTSTTRVADNCSKTGISELIGQSEGTIYIEFDNNQLSTYPNEYIYQIVDGSTELWIRKESGGSGFTARLIVSGSTIWTIGIIPPDGLTKIATAYKSGDSVIYMNGTIVGSVNTSTFSGSSFNTLNFFRSTLKPELLLKQAILFPTRLTNDQLAELTK